MHKPRVHNLLLGTFLLAVAAVLGIAAVQRFVPPGPAATLTLLRDGDLEGSERKALLRRLVGFGDDGDPAQRLGAAMAAIGLDDEASFRRLFGDGRALLPEFAARGALGDPVLDPMLAAMTAESRGDRQEARRRFQQVAASSRLFHMPLAATLCQQALARLQ